MDGQLCGSGHRAGEGLGKSVCAERGARPRRAPRHSSSQGAVSGGGAPRGRVSGGRQGGRGPQSSCPRSLC